MKTRIIIEIETSNMAKIVPEEYIGHEDDCPKNEELTEEIEKSLHNNFQHIIKNLIEDKEYIFEHIDEEDIPENVECLDDFGRVSITIKEDTPYEKTLLN